MLPTDTNESIAQEGYPLTSTELVERYGDQELELPNGTELLSEVLNRQGDEVFQSAEEVRTALYNGVSHAAVGRRFYSDRDPTTLGSPHGHEQLSF